MPQEIQDMIFLQLGPYGSDYETLKNTRILQSEYVHKCTEFDNFKDAAYYSNLDNMKWLLKIGCKFDAYTFSCSIDFALRDNEKYNALTNMKWLKENGCPWDKSAYEYAARQAIYNECKIGSSIRKDKLIILNWLKENGCPQGSIIFNSVVSYGNLEIIKWFNLNRFPQDEYTALIARSCKDSKKKKDIINYLNNNN